MKDNILYYTGRILPSQEFGDNLSMTPNTLLLGKNNDCSPSVPVHITNDPGKIIAMVWSLDD